MTGIDPNLDLANINAYIKCGEILSVCSQDIELYRILAKSSAIPGKNLAKMTSINPNLDLANINAYTKLGKILSIRSQDIEQKRNSGVNQGP